MSSRVLLFCALLCCYVPIRPVYLVQTTQLDAAKDGIRDTVESPDGESGVLVQRRSASAQQTTDRRLDDIMFSSEQEAETTTAEPGYTHIWPNKTIYYTFEYTLNFEYRSAFVAAMNEWAFHSCIQFYLAASQWQDHILFVRSEDLGCSSYVGRKGGLQIISMADDCFSTGQAIHLVGHAIGLWHEHSRPDRDRYVDVLYENINETEHDNFGKISQEKFNLVPDVGYDTESVMHYSPYRFTKNNGETIRLRDDAPLDYKRCSNLLSMGQREQLSYLDKLRVNKLYSCQGNIAALGTRTCIPGSSPILAISESTSPQPLSEVTTISKSSPTTSESLPTSTSESPPTASDHELIPTTSESQPPPLKCPFSVLLPQLSPLFRYPPYRLRTGNVITLQLLQNASKGMRCDPGCSLKECQQFTPQPVCHTIDFQFEIVAVERQDSKKIKSGDKVALRSRCDPSKWLNCAGGNSRNECSITNCSSCVGSACYDAGFVTPCDNHHFKIFGIGRRENRLINTKYQIYFRPAADGNNSILSCYDELCKLSSSGNFTVGGETLGTAQRFTFSILSATEV